MSDLLARRGDVIMAPDRKGGYRVLRAICGGDRPSATSVEAFGDVPVPEVGEVVPNWFLRALMDARGREAGGD